VNDGTQETEIPETSSEIPMQQEFEIPLEVLADSASDKTNSNPDKPEAKKANAEAQQVLSQKECLMIVATGIDLWHGQDKIPYATISEGSKKTNLLIGSAEFKESLCLLAYQKFGITPSNQSMEEVLRILSAQAKYKGKKFETSLRIAGDSHTSFLDLVDESGTLVKTDAGGVFVALSEMSASFRFLQRRGMRELPRPIMPLSMTRARAIIMKRLRTFCNLKDDKDYLLFVVALLSAYRAVGPFVVVLIVGEQGSAKSTQCKVFRSLVDPSEVPLRTPPREERDLWIATKNSWLIAFDNISALSQQLSDAICRLTTGGGNSYRKLYEDEAEALFNAQRLVLITTIDDLSLRGDLSDRSIKLTCAAISPERRKTEEEFWSAFREQQPKLLGALLLLLSETLKQLPKVNLQKSPRMADFAKFGVAVEKALLLPDGTFMAAYEENRSALTAQALEGKLANLITKLELPVSMTATDLWDSLKSYVGGNGFLPKWFPSNPQQLSRELNRLKPFLREFGIEVGDRRLNKSKLITLTDVKNTL